MVSFSNNDAVFTMTISLSLSSPFFFFFFQLLFTVRTTSFSPVDHFAVACGNLGNIRSSDNRNWTGDIGSRIFSPIEPRNGLHSVVVNASVRKTVPYGTARLSYSEFSYSFPVTSGRKIIRFYFYPSSYDLNFLRSDSLFSVKASSLPLLMDYNASLAADKAAEETFFKEYVVTVDPGQRLNVTFMPSVSYENAYAFINGIEVFSSPTDLYYPNLDNIITGSNPVSRPSPSLPSSKSSKNAKNTRVIFIVGGVASGIVVLSLILLLIFLRFAKGSVKEGKSWWGQKTVAMSKTRKTQGTSLLSSDLCRVFSIDEIRAATNNFDDIFIIGFGGFGNVYKSYIDEGTIPVAIKRLKQGSQQGLQEFQTEIEMLSQLRHNHLVSLIGYCNEGNEMILVYEFMANGTLREHLYNSDHHSLSWIQRLEICIGAARGIHYLHTGTKHAIIHRDIKSTNILIDEKWMAKISDFGLSKVGPSGILRSNINISTVVKGSIGYLDPEYCMCQRLTEKSDVYSFGVVLLEVLCGRPPILRAVERQQQNLAEWVRRCVHEGEIGPAVDPFLRESMRPDCIEAYIEIALKCVANDGNERPAMGDVMLGLEFVLEMLRNEEEISSDD
ncbi:receptor-like protein kinase FERONIA [Prosopis cineraria]|uniref:receptor-like protein kinase FERONIA n=1 Tax=Prosopis cineraria TaxID=364024 RepID=UPI002410296A|nr:receptor-like protein kinase FERONIA [Prosopis cineraria]